MGRWSASSPSETSRAEGVGRNVVDVALPAADHLDPVGGDVDNDHARAAEDECLGEGEPDVAGAQ